jgi:CheY-like chemotaxis protein
MLKALVVEDEEDIKQLLLEELEDRGYQVLAADNGEIAMKIVAEQKPDIIFVDVYMPVMNGLDLITRLKRDPELADIPMALVTVMNALDTEENARKLGVEYCITKPWERCELDAALDRAFKPSSLGI